MTFAELKTELAALGYDYLSATRAGQFVNDGYQHLCEEEDWPFLEASTSGSSPVTVSDLRKIETVRDSANNTVLVHENREALTRKYGDLTTTGTPESYYIDSGTIVRTYPVGGTLAIRYWKVPATLTGTDTPVVPARYHRLLLEYAVLEAAHDANDRDAIAETQAKIDGQLARMRRSLLSQHREGGRVQIVAGSEDW